MHTNMPEKFKTNNTQSSEKIDLLPIYNKLDQDPELVNLLGQYFEDGEVVGELIHPSNMVELNEGGKFKINAGEFDRMIKEEKEEAQGEPERIAVLKKIEPNKQKIVLRIARVLEELGYHEIEINE